MTKEVDELREQLDTEQAARRHAEEALRALSNGGELIARHASSERVLQELVDQILQTTKADVVLLYPYGEATKQFQLPPHESGVLVGQESPELNRSRPDEIAWLTLRHGHPVFANRSGTLAKGLGGVIAQQSSGFEQHEKIKSTAAVPLLVGDEPVGVLFVNFRVPQPFDDPQKHLIQGLAHHAATAIKNARNYARAEKESRRFSQLYATSWELAQITDAAELDKAYQIVLQRADAAEESQAFIFRFEEETEELVIRHSLRLRNEVKFRRIRLDEGVNGQVARERRPIVVCDTQDLPAGVATPRPLDLPVNSLVVVPLQFGDRYYGNLALSCEKANYFRDADVELLEGLAKQLALTIYRLETTEAQREAEQKAKEAEVMSLMGQSTLELAHRLGNDLTPVRHHLNNLRQTLVSHGVEISLVDEDLNRIRQDVDGVLGLSNGLRWQLADWRDAAGLKSSVIPVGELFREIALSYPNLPANVQVRFDIEDEIAPVRAVVGQVTNALRNLFSNAVEAMPEGGTIVLGAHNAGNYVKLEVTDEGPGIPPEQRGRVFDLFYSTKGSSGFGLWSARRYALANGGDLTVTSKAGHGTTLTLLWPNGIIE